MIYTTNKDTIGTGPIRPKSIIKDITMVAARTNSSASKPIRNYAIGSYRSKI